MITFSSFRGATVRPGPLPPFTPQSLNPIIWLDASDSTTLFDTTLTASAISGGYIGKWTSKGTEAQSFSGYGGYSTPIYYPNASLTNTGVVRIPTSGGSMRILTSSIGQNVPGLTFCIAAKMQTTNNAFNPLFSSLGDNTSYNRFYFDVGRGNNTKFNISGRRKVSPTPDTFAILPSITTLTAGQWAFFGGVINYVDTDAFTYFNSGTFDSSDTNFLNNSAANTENSVSLSSVLGPNTTNAGFDIGEILIFNYALNSSQLTKVFTYLDSRW